MKRSEVKALNASCMDEHIFSVKDRWRDGFLNARAPKIVKRQFKSVLRLCRRARDFPGGSYINI